MHTFFAPVISGDTCVLSEEESAHCMRVLRLSQGDELTITDGNGGFYRGKISSAKNKLCEIELLETFTKQERPLQYLHIAIAPTKNMERLEWFVEKATEIGIDEISPIICAHSERRVLKTERIQKVLISAMKQSQRRFLPKLNEPVSFHTFIEKGFAGKSFIAIHSANTLLKNTILAQESNLILIGPEGDFSPEEINFAKKNNFMDVSLGNFRLRTETAALVAVQTFNLMNQ